MQILGHPPTNCDPVRLGGGVCGPALRSATCLDYGPCTEETVALVSWPF